MLARQPARLHARQTTSKLQIFISTLQRATALCEPAISPFLRCILLPLSYKNLYLLSGPHLFLDHGSLRPPAITQRAFRASTTWSRPISSPHNRNHGECRLSSLFVRPAFSRDHQGQMMGNCHHPASGATGEAPLFLLVMPNKSSERDRPKCDVLHKFSSQHISMRSSLIRSQLLQSPRRRPDPFYAS